MNTHLFADVGHFGLRHALRAKRSSIITEAVCDALLGMCCKEPPTLVPPATIGGGAADALDAALEDLASVGTSNAVPLSSADDVHDDGLSALLSAPGAILANVRVLRILFLDGQLWSACSARRRRGKSG